jgi:hypothetical protein
MKIIRRNILQSRKRLLKVFNDSMMTIFIQYNFYLLWKNKCHRWFALSPMDDNITNGNNKIICSQFFSFIRHLWQRTKWSGLVVVIYISTKWLLFTMFKMTWTMMTWLFNVIIKWLYFEQHDNWWIIWLPCNDINKNNMTIDE